MFNTTVKQNRAHRLDLTWIKVGKSEYMRSDGVTLRKHPTRPYWFAYQADGSKMLDKTHNYFHVGDGTLTWAKLAVENNG